MTSTLLPAAVIIRHVQALALHWHRPSFRWSELRLEIPVIIGIILLEMALMRAHRRLRGPRGRHTGG